MMVGLGTPGIPPVGGPDVSGIHNQSGLPKAELNRIFVKSLGATATAVPDVDLEPRPVEVEVSLPLPSPLRAYLYTLTYNVAERKQGSYRCQVILPGASSGSGGRSHLDTADGAFVVLGGYEPEVEVFCMWDAGIYDGEGFTYSRGMQVDDTTIYEAATTGLAQQVRYPRPGGGKAVEEVVVAARRDKLVEGLRRRWQLTNERLIGS